MVGINQACLILLYISIFSIMYFLILCTINISRLQELSHGVTNNSFRITIIGLGASAFIMAKKDLEAKRVEEMKKEG